MVLLHKIPLQVFSSTIEYERDGLVMNLPGEFIPSKGWIRKQVAVLLGGLCAERMIFGEDSITLGSNQDLRTATQLIMDALMNHGFYKAPASFSNANDDCQMVITSLIPEIDKECMNWLREAEHLATNSLNENRDLLLHCAWKLSQRRSIDQKELKSLFGEYACVEEKDTWFENANHTEQYRNILFEQVQRSNLAV
jgi:cell division protease FtsH